MTDQEYVRSVWPGRADYCGAPSNPIRIFTSDDVKCFRDFSAAAEFTRERLEQVRQLREEINVVAQAMWRCKTGDFIQRVAVWKRVFARLESALATLTQGMKPDVQP